MRRPLEATEAGVGTFTPLPLDARQTAAPEAGRLVAAALSLALGAPGIFGGIRLWGAPGPLGERVSEALPSPRRLPIACDAERLLGGVDLAAALAGRRTTRTEGLLTALRGPLLVPCAERLSAEVAGILAQYLDRAAAVGADAYPIVAYDEAEGDDAPMAAALTDRLAFAFMASAPLTSFPELGVLPADWRSVELPAQTATSLTEAALALGVTGLRAGWHAAQCAKGVAALAGRGTVDDADAADAATLVLGPRALPPAEAEPHEPAKLEATSSSPQDDRCHEGSTGAGVDEPGERRDDNEATPPQDAADRVVAAVLAGLDAGLLAVPARASTRGAVAGRAGANARSARGKPGGVRAGMPGRDGHLALVETLVAAAPWRAVRGAPPGRLPVRRSDLRVRRTVSPAATTTVFAVDASGSQAFARMAEAKGAVEEILAAAYARRDCVALVAFRRTKAELLLPATSSLTRAKRALAALPAGGGTPLAAGLRLALRLCLDAARAGREPTLVVLTDGRANVTLAEEGDRPAAVAEATAAARAIHAANVKTLLIDTAARPRPGGAAEQLAKELGGRYVPLPRADAATIARLAVERRR